MSDKLKRLAYIPDIVQLTPKNSRLIIYAKDTTTTQLAEELCQSSRDIQSKCSTKFMDTCCPYVFDVKTIENTYEHPHDGMTFLTHHIGHSWLYARDTIFEIGAMNVIAIVESPISIIKCDFATYSSASRSKKMHYIKTYTYFDMNFPGGKVDCRDVGFVSSDDRIGTATRELYEETLIKMKVLDFSNVILQVDDLPLKLACRTTAVIEWNNEERYQFVQIIGKL